MKINSLYISVKDRDRAKNFYQNIIFERKPSSHGVTKDSKGGRTVECGEEMVKEKGQAN